MSSNNITSSAMSSNQVTSSPSTTPIKRHDPALNSPEGAWYDRNNMNSPKNQYIRSISASPERANKYLSHDQHTIVSYLESLDMQRHNHSLYSLASRSTANTSLASTNNEYAASISSSTHLLDNNNNVVVKNNVNVHVNIVNNTIYTNKHAFKLDNLTNAVSTAQGKADEAATHLNAVMASRYAAKAHSSMAFEQDLRTGGEKRQMDAEYAKISADRTLEKAQRKLELERKMEGYGRVGRAIKRVFGGLKEMVRSEDDYELNVDVGAVGLEGCWSQESKRWCSPSRDS